MSALEKVLQKIPTYSQELKLDLRKPKDCFKWLLASVLFAKRISATIAKKTYSLFEAKGLTTPEAILRAGWDKLVEVLDAGGYVRYDFSTASTLLELAKQVKSLEGLEEIHRAAEDSRDLERKLMKLRGVGPTAMNIFLRELRGIWAKADPAPSPLALQTARKLGISRVRDFESALVRINLEYCKHQKCSNCPVLHFCKD